MRAASRLLLDDPQHVNRHLSDLLDVRQVGGRHDDDALGQLQSPSLDGLGIATAGASDDVPGLVEGLQHGVARGRRKGRGFSLKKLPGTHMLPRVARTGVSGSLRCRCAERACLGYDRQFLVGLGNLHHGLFGDRIGQVVGEAAGLLSALSPMRRAVEFRRHSVGTTTRATVRFLAARSEASASLQLLLLLVLKLSTVCETNVGLGDPQHDALGDRIRKAP